MCSGEQEVEELKQDLEVCKQRLDAKYNAITILKRQVAWNIILIIKNFRLYV